LGIFVAIFAGAPALLNTSDFQDLFLSVVVFSVHLVTNDGKSGIGRMDGI
jgi:hypothetical protein